MQEPVNFSCTAVYSTPQELAVRLLNNLQNQNSNPPPNFDMRASSLPRDFPPSSITEQAASIQSIPWAVFPSNAFLAAAAAAAFSVKSVTSSASNWLQETKSSNKSSQEINLYTEKAISEHAPFSVSQHSASSKCDVPLNQEVDSAQCSQHQSLRRNLRTGERGRRSRVVIHQFGDAEDHFSKALRNLHVKSAGEYEMLGGAAATPKRVWKLTSTYDGEEEGLDAPISSPYLEVQNIADLAVEKHFEKSLATFHAKKAAAAAAAAATAATVATAVANEVTSKSSLDLSLPRNQAPFSPSSSSNSSSALLSPREDPNGGPSFNPKKKWLAQYGDDEIARTDVDESKNNVWSSDDSTWKVKNRPTPTNIDQRSKSCPLLTIKASHFLKSPPNCKFKRDLISNELSRAKAAQSSVASLLKRGFSSMARTLSLEISSPGDCIDFFEDGDEVVVATKSISAQESPTSSPIADSSGFFTDSTYSLDSSNLPVISEAGYFSSNVSVNSSFKAKHFAAPQDKFSLDGRKEQGFFGSGSEEGNDERCWPIRKRTASDASDLSCFKRSRSVVDADCVEHS